VCAQLHVPGGHVGTVSKGTRDRSPLVEVVNGWRSDDILLFRSLDANRTGIKAGDVILGIMDWFIIALHGI
jgi:hypothetical protein